MQDAFALEPQLDDEIIADIAADAPLNDGARSKVLHFVAADELRKIIRRVPQSRCHGGIDVGIHVAKGIDKIEIDHKAVRASKARRSIVVRGPKNEPPTSARSRRSNPS